MTERPLSESFDISGDWYLPENPLHRIAGVLHYTPEQTELQLNGSFRPMRGTIRAGDNPQIYPIVYGLTTKGEAMTILKAQRKGVSINFGSGGIREPETLISSWLLIGAHVSEDQIYSEFSFRVPGLEVWLSKPIIEQTIGQNPPTDRTTSSFRITPVDKVITTIPLIDASLEWGISWNLTSNLFTSMSLKVSAWVTIKPVSPHQIKWYLEQQIKLTAFLTFLAGTPMPPDCIEAFIDNQTKIACLLSMANRNYCPFKNLHEFFIPRKSIENQFNNVLIQWFDIYPTIIQPSQLALSVLSSENQYLHIEFLSLMQALEGLHRSVYNGNYMDEQNYEPVKKVLCEAIPYTLSEDHKEALRTRIRYGYQVSLQKRLDELTENLSESNRKLILGENGKVPHKWVDSRNYYTHWDEELRPNILDEQGMYYANMRMQHFLRAIYLNLMGIAQETIQQSLLNASRISQNLAQLNLSEHFRDNQNDKSGVIMTVIEQGDENANKPLASQNMTKPPFNNSSDEEIKNKS